MSNEVTGRIDGHDASQTGTNGPRVRKLNESLVLDLVRRNGNSSRAWIADELDLEFQTVSNICNRLIDSGYLLDGGVVEGLKRQSRGVVVNPRAVYAIGVEINRAGANVAVVGFDGGVVDSVQLIVAGRSVDDVVEDIAAACERLRAALVVDTEKVIGIGISVPGPIDAPTGRILEPANFAAWHGLRIGDLLGGRLGLPAWVNTTATSAALGAQWAAAGSAYDDFVYVYLGGGIGLGVIANGRPLRGVQGNAGEFAHLVSDPSGPLCSCGQRGCLVQFATPQALLSNLQEAWVDERRRDPGRTVPMPTSFEAALSPGAPQWMVDALDSSMRTIARAVTRVATTLDPAAVLFGGPTSNHIGGRLVEHVNSVWRATPTFGRSAPEVVTVADAELSGVIGAASLPLHSRFSPRALR